MEDVRALTLPAAGMFGSFKLHPEQPALLLSEGPAEVECVVSVDDQPGVSEGGVRLVLRVVRTDEGAGLADLVDVGQQHGLSIGETLDPMFAGTQKPTPMA